MRPQVPSYLADFIKPFLGRRRISPLSPSGPTGNPTATAIATLDTSTTSNAPASTDTTATTTSSSTKPKAIDSSLTRLQGNLYLTEVVSDAVEKCETAPKKRGLEENDGLSRPVKRISYSPSSSSTESKSDLPSSPSPKDSITSSASVTHDPFSSSSSSSTTTTSPTPVSPLVQNNLYICRVPRLQSTWRKLLKGRIGPGLHNLGLTCYLSAVLQCLMHTPSLVAHLLQSEDRAVESGQGSSKEFCAHRELRRFAIEYWSARNQKGAIAPHIFVKHLQKLSKGFHRFQQQDSHEFLIKLMAAMEAACLKSLGPQAATSPARPSILPDAIWGGKETSRVTCDPKGHTSDKVTALPILSLNVWGTHSIEEALKVYIRPDIFNGSNKYQCDGCHAKVDAKRRTTISTPPTSLILHLQRLDFMGDMYKGKVEFPRILDLLPYIGPIKPTSPALYQLHGVLVHSGTYTNGGHYYAYVRGADSEWYLADDESTCRVPFSSVAKVRAYMLFYSLVDEGRSIAKEKEAKLHEEMKIQREQEQERKTKERGILTGGHAETNGMEGKSKGEEEKKKKKKKKKKNKSKKQGLMGKNGMGVDEPPSAIEDLLDRIDQNDSATQEESPSSSSFSSSLIDGKRKRLSEETMDLGEKMKRDDQMKRKKIKSPQMTLSDSVLDPVEASMATSSKASLAPSTSSSSSVALKSEKMTNKPVDVGSLAPVSHTRVQQTLPTTGSKDHHVKEATVAGKKAFSSMLPSLKQNIPSLALAPKMEEDRVKNGPAAPVVSWDGGKEEKIRHLEQVIEREAARKRESAQLLEEGTPIDPRSTVSSSLGKGVFAEQWDMEGKGTGDTMASRAQFIQAEEEKARQDQEALVASEWDQVLDQGHVRKVRSAIPMEERDNRRAFDQQLSSRMKGHSVHRGRGGSKSSRGRGGGRGGGRGQGGRGGRGGGGPRGSAHPYSSRGRRGRG